MRNHLGKMIVLGTILSLSLAPAFAQGRGGGGGVGGGVGGGLGVGGGVGVGGGSAQMGGQSGVNGQLGGQSKGNISVQGQANTNGPDATDRDFGRDRASDRSDVTLDRTNNSARDRAANELGSLNAAHASETARAHASSGSMVGEIGTYETQMKAALAMSNMAQRNAAITQARQQLAENTNKTLTAGVIARLDSTLAIQGASPQLGASQ